VLVVVFTVYTQLN